MHESTAARWWQGAVLYQLYVRSWRDSDGDGYGDLGGLIDNLDYLAWLGVDGIWLSPTMPSPDDDWGYDVSDYVGVHPELGTLAQLDELIAEAGRRGLRVLLDLVPNHSSSAHPWFVAAAGDPGSEYRDYYVWADPKPDGAPPNNWVDFTGHPAWTLEETSGQYYLHNFLPSQPDLNWWNPAVHTEFAEILRFWFDRGVAGFRIDVAHGLYKDAQLRDNPQQTERSELAGRFGLLPKYNANRPQTHQVYRDWRQLADGYPQPRLLLGETWVPDASQLASYYGDDDQLQLGFNFPFVFTPFEAAGLAGTVAATLAALTGPACPVWMGSNHDVGRFPSRWCGGDPRQARLALLILGTLPGTSVLYYGDELGMTDVDVPPELRRDQMSADPAASRDNRDRARTPLRWDDSDGAGFTKPGVTPWLPFGQDAGQTVAAQRDDPESLLSWCRAVLALRRQELRLPDGGQPAYRELASADGVWDYQVGGLRVTLNLTGRPQPAPSLAGLVLLDTEGPQPAAPGSSAEARPELAPWAGLVTRYADSTDQG
jgi:alpha-glucosidase